MTIEPIYSIQKKKRISHLFIISIKLMTYLWMMVTILCINIMHHFYRRRTTKMNPQDQNIIQQNEEFVTKINILDFFVLNDTKLSSHMAQISEQINSSNNKIHSYYQVIKMIVNLVSKKEENNDTSSCQLTCIKNSLLMSIVDTPEKDLSNVDQKYYTRKVRTSSVKSSSTLFSY